jgi:DNA-binding transcriptional ArsR family regulator
LPAEPAEVFAALGDETRLALVARLIAEGPASIVRLSTGATMTRQAVTKHLQVLEKAGLVRCERIGRTTLWRLEAPAIDRARRTLDLLSRHWDDRLARLRDHVET